MVYTIINQMEKYQTKNWYEELISKETMQISLIFQKAKFQHSGCSSKNVKVTAE